MSEKVENFLQSGVKVGRGLVSLIQDVKALNVSHDEQDIKTSAKAVAERMGIDWNIVKKYL